jgi:alkylhydroperoxidase/carboxymuconolactone decarboxylase family protein YurZ
MEEETPPKPPGTYTAFVKRFPDLGEAWEHIGRAGGQGPLDAETRRLVKLGIAIGAMREGSVHSSVRKATAAGISIEALEQVVALAAGTIGMPSTVAGWTWVHDELHKDRR